MRKSSRRLGSIALVVVVGLTLTACDPYPPATNTLAVREGENGLEIAICEDFVVEVLLFDYRTPGEEWVSTTWDGLGQALHAGDTIRLQAPPELPGKELLVDGTEIYILVNDGSSVADARFVVDRPIDELWLQGSGTRDPTPCAAS